MLFRSGQHGDVRDAGRARAVQVLHHGAPHAFDCELERTLGGRWSLHWTFPPHGVIALECAEVQLLGAAVA